MNFLDWLIAKTRTISQYSLWFAAGFMIFSVLLIGAEVILRKLGIGLISGASEVGGYMLATCSVWAFSYTLLQRSNIRFDILYVRFEPHVRAFLDVVSLIALGVFIYTLTYHSHAVLSTSIALGARSPSSLSIPMWIPQSVWFAGLIFLCWTILVLTLRSAWALIQGDLATVMRLAGTSIREEEIERETTRRSGA